MLLWGKDLERCGRPVICTFACKERVGEMETGFQVRNTITSGGRPLPWAGKPHQRGWQGMHPTIPGSCSDAGGPGEAGEVAGLAQRGGGGAGKERPADPAGGMGHAPSSLSPPPNLPWNSKWPMRWPWASWAAVLLKLPRRVLPWLPCGHQQHVRATASSRSPPMPVSRSSPTPRHPTTRGCPPHVGSWGRRGRRRRPAALEPENQ